MALTKISTAMWNSSPHDPAQDFNVDDVLFVDVSADRVGIGTTSPNNAGLVVGGSGGSARIAIQRTNANTTGTFGQLGFQNLNGEYVSGIVAYGDGNDAGSHLAFHTTSDAVSTDDNVFELEERLRIDSVGHVGINQTSPTAALHAVNSAAIGESIAIFEALATKNGYVYINADDNRRKLLVFQSGGVDKFSMGVGDSDEISTGTFFIGAGKGGGNNADLVINASGNVGIGTTSPSDPFHLAMANGDIRMDAETDRNHILSRNSADDNWRDIAISASSGQSQLVLTTDGSVGIGTTSPEKPLHVEDSNTNGIIARFRDGSGASLQRLDISSIATGMQIRSAYSTGISNQLNIETAGGNSFITLATNSTERMRITSGGTVGIGHTNPISYLAVRDNARITWGSGAQRLLMGNQDSAGVNNPAIIQAANGNLYFGGGNSWSAGDGGTMDHTMTLLDSGNVGIGTTSPAYPFEVNAGVVNNIARFVSSDANANLLIADGNSTQSVGIGAETNDLKLISGGTERVRIDSSGNVGIGTTSPNHALDIGFGTGSVKHSGLITATYLGTTSGPGVANGFTASLNDQDGQSLNIEYHYEIELTTSSTGTRTGASYVVWYDTSSSSWRNRYNSVAGVTSNHPLLTTSGQNVIIYTNHSNAYSIRYRVRAKYNQEDAATPHSLGAAYQWRRYYDNLYYDDGNVGINTSLPSELLDVNQENNISTIAISRGGSDLGTSTGVGKIVFKADYQGSPVEYGNIYAYANVTSGVRSSIDFNVKSTSGNILTGMTVYGSGSYGPRVGIGTTAPSVDLEVVGTIQGTTLTETSALRFKENIQEDVDSSIIDKLRPVSYDWKETGDKDYGFIAEEVNELESVLTTKDEDGQLLGIKYTKLIPFLVKKIQEQEERIKQLENGNS